MGVFTRKKADFAGDSHTFTNPYRTSAFEVDGKQIEVLWYHTDVKAEDDAITDDELTPVVLTDGRVTGWGWDYWQDTATKYEIRLR